MFTYVFICCNFYIYYRSIFTFIIDLELLFCVVWSKGQVIEKITLFPLYHSVYEIWNLFLEYLFCSINRLSFFFLSKLSHYINCYILY